MYIRYFYRSVNFEKQVIVILKLGVKYVYMKIEELQQLTGEQKLEEIYKSVEQMRQYFKWTLIITLIFFILPLVALIFIIPSFLNSLNYSSLGL